MRDINGADRTPTIPTPLGWSLLVLAVAFTFVGALPELTRIRRVRLQSLIADGILSEDSVTRRTNLPP